MITFEHLNKLKFPVTANKLFNILADNMAVIAPTGNSRKEDYKCWYKAVGAGLRKKERHIILIKDNDTIIGFFQYYINSDALMMEEIQIKPEYQGRGLVRELYAFADSNIKTDVEFVEAYANTKNTRSIGMLEKFGLKSIGLNKNGCSYHFKGRKTDLKKWYEKN